MSKFSIESRKRGRKYEINMTASEYSTAKWFFENACDLQGRYYRMRDLSTGETVARKKC